MAFDLIGLIAVGMEFLGWLLWPLLALVLADLGLVAYLLSRRRPLAVGAAVRIVVPVGIVVAIAVAAALPAWTGAGFGQLTSLLDYLVIVGGGLGVGVVTGLLLYPPIQLLRTR